MEWVLDLMFQRYWSMTLIRPPPPIPLKFMFQSTKSYFYEARSERRES